MNLRRRFPSYQLSEAAKSDVNRIQAVWRHSRERFAGERSWLFGEFSIADEMYAPVVMRFQSAATQLNDTTAEYCRTVVSAPSVREWVRRGLKEKHIVEEDELDWPSESILSADNFASDR